MVIAAYIKGHNTCTSACHKLCDISLSTHFGAAARKVSAIFVRQLFCYGSALHIDLT